MAFLTVLVPAIAAFLAPGASAYPNYCEVERSLPENSTAKSIEWGTCPESFPAPPNVQCANFSVPIDWDNPSGERFVLGMVKLLAGTANYSVYSSKRDNGYIGSLFFNPGGPGQSASEIVLGIATVIPTVQALTQHFDIIGLDPRGVGLSQQINCSTEIMAERVSLFPQTQSDYDALVDKNKRFGESCRNLSGSLVDYIDTIRQVNS
jgi:pimeloyl-ACP methyl ester carboxylesterase